MPAHFKWTDEATQDMITSYQNGESITSIASRYHANHHTVSSMLVEQGIVLRTRAEYSRECTCNYAYFHHIDTEEKAYWLGFLTADGCITTGHRISIHLGTIDCSHLYKLKSALNATHKVSINIRSCKFVVRSPEMAADLARYGILPHKTFSTKPFQVAPELMRHYWRGILDGDGHISKNGESLTLVGDYDIVQGFQAFVLSLCPYVKAKIHRKENIYSFILMRDATRCILQPLYKNALVFLERKYERAQQVFT